MNKSEYFRVFPPDHPLAEEWKEKIRISYAMAMWKLQEMCGLTYKEARAYLLHYRESEEKFAKDLNITVASVRKLKNRAAQKVRSSGFSREQIFGKYNIICLRSTESRDTIFDDDTEAYLQAEETLSGAEAGDRS